jgi:hypothetical protein
MEQLQEALQQANAARDAVVAQQAAAEATTVQAVMVTNAAQAAAAAANAAALAAGLPPPATVFALSPALAMSNALLDYTSSEDTIKIYNKATAPIEALYDGGLGNLRLFLSKMQQKGNQYRWTRILTINQGTSSYNLVTSYGQVELSSVRTQATQLEVAGSRET